MLSGVARRVRRFLNRVHKFDSCRGMLRVPKKAPQLLNFRLYAELRSFTPIYAHFRRAQGQSKGSRGIPLDEDEV